MVRKATGEMIGDCGIIRQHVEGEHLYEIGYHLRRDHWGRGLATEAGRAIRDHAVTVLRLRRLVALIHPENAASERVAAKLGFRREGEVERPCGMMRLLAFMASGPGNTILQNNPMH